MYATYGLHRFMYHKLAFTPEACQYLSEIFLARGLSGKHNGPTWWSGCPEGKVRT